MENDNEVKEPKLENETDLIEALKKSKENMVSMEKYQKVLEENKRMIEAFTEGKELDQEQKEPPVSTEQLRKNLVEAKTNLEYAKASLELRKRNLEETGKDDYLPNAAQYQPTQADKDSAERFATVLEQCIEEAHGNSAVFTALLDSRTDDINLPRRK